MLAEEEEPALDGPVDEALMATTGGPGIIGKLIHKERGVRIQSHEEDDDEAAPKKVSRQELVVCGCTLVIVLAVCVAFGVAFFYRNIKEH